MMNQIGQGDRKNNPDTTAGQPASQLFPQLLETQRKQKKNKKLKVV